MNEEIRSREVRVIGENGQQLGILPLSQALTLAQEHELDLVEVAPTTVPPVCRILDYGKFCYEQTKREREARKVQKVSLLRQIRLRTRIGVHDKDAKVRRAQELLREGNKVKLSVVFRGREITHPEIGLNLLRSVAEALKEEAKLEAPPGMEGRMMTITLVPTPKREAKATKSAQEQASGQKAEEVKT